MHIAFVSHNSHSGWTISLQIELNQLIYSLGSVLICIELEAQYVGLFSKKSNLHYTRGILLKRTTSDGVHLRGLASGEHSFEETSQRWQAVGGSV